MTTRELQQAIKDKKVVFLLKTICIDDNEYL